MRNDTLEPEIFTGAVKWYAPEKFYGFIIPDQMTGEVFVHINQLKKAGLEGLHQDDRVRFSIGEHKGRPQAIDIELI